MTPKYVELTDNIFHISENDEVCVTLIVGEESALLIDTAHGKLDLNKIVKSFTNKPFKVVISHVHPDHARGCCQFPVSYVCEADIPLIDFHCSDVPFNYDILKIGEIIDLGGRTIEVVSLPGHTPGSVGFLLREESILFAGDALNSNLWLFLDECLSLSEYRKTLDYASGLPFDRYVSPHSNDFFTKNTIECLKQIIDTLVIDESTREEILGFEVYSSSCTLNGETCRICYSKAKL